MIDFGKSKSNFLYIFIGNLISLRLKCINCKYPKTKADNKGINIVEANNKQKASIINGIYFILIKQGIQQKVVYY